MKRLAATFLILLLGVCGAVAQVIDQERLEQLDARLEQYFSILEAQSADVKAEECDALIEAATEPTLRQAIALKIYDHYRASKLMGDEAVAIHLTDKWFAPGKIAMKSQDDLFEAKMFAELNHQSLLGMEAPRLELVTPYGEILPVPVVRQAHQPVSEPVEGRSLSSVEGLSLLYFYDTECAKCKLETATLRSLLEDNDYPILIYAIYVGTNEARWKEWRESYFKMDLEETEIVHLWDPDAVSDLQFKYGVVQTPKMFLLDGEGIIVGRGLDTETLGQMLDNLLDDGSYTYGAEASKNLFDQIFLAGGTKVTADDVASVASMISQRTLAQGDTLAFKHLAGDLLYYLASRRDEGLREGSAGFIDSYILSRPEIWNTEDDSLMVVGMAEMLDGLLGKAPVGSTIPRMCLKGWNRFRKQGGYIFFHSEGCPVCEEEMALADSLGLKYYSVNMDALEARSARKFMKLLDTFDLSSLPFVMEIGKGGKVLRRYVSLSDDLLFLDEKQ